MQKCIGVSCGFVNAFYEIMYSGDACSREVLLGFSDELRGELKRESSRMARALFSESIDQPVYFYFSTARRRGQFWLTMDLGRMRLLHPALQDSQ